MNRKGFSLVEIMVVVAIIGVLAAIAVPKYDEYKMRASRSEAKFLLSALYAAEKSHFMEHDSYTVSLTYAGFVPDYMLLNGNGCPIAARPGTQVMYSIGFNVDGVGNGRALYAQRGSCRPMIPSLIDPGLASFRPEPPTMIARLSEAIIPSANALVGTVLIIPPTYFSIRYPASKPIRGFAPPCSWRPGTRQFVAGAWGIFRGSIDALSINESRQINQIVTAGSPVPKVCDTLPTN